MDQNRDLVPPATSQVLQKNPFSFHPWRAVLGAVLGLFGGMVLCAAMNQWRWLLLAPGAALFLAFDFWRLLFADEDDISLKPPVWWSRDRDGNE